VVLLAGVPTAAWAAEGDPVTRWEVTAKGGIGLETNSQSLALEHALQPRARLEVLTDLSPDVRVGVELSGVLSGESGYQLIGGWFVGRAAMSRGDVFSSWVGFGAGVGTDAAILHPDLVSGGDLALWHQLGVLFRWELGAGVSLGVDVMSENLSAISLAGTAGLHF
jgi:hypothetical protein